MENNLAPLGSNKFGFLRILFASLVVMSHSPQLIDGSPSREVLVRTFGTLSFGEIAVDGFFLVSGYLITMSFDRRPQLGSFFRHRVMRIAPAYLINYWLCLLVLAPLVGAGSSVFEPSFLGHALLEAVKLHKPEAPGAFAGLPDGVLNGSAWTIAHEFRCYMAVAVLGTVAGLLPFSRGALRPPLVAAIGVLLLLHVLDSTGEAGHLLGRVSSHVRLGSVFGVGALFYIYRSVIPMRRGWAVVSAALLCVGLCFAPVAEVAVAIFGGYLVFFVALHGRLGPLKALDNLADGNGRWGLDISYGLYLYACPIQNTIILWDRTIDPWFLTVVTLACAGTAGALSWVLVERHCNRWARRPGFDRWPDPPHGTRADQPTESMVLEGTPHPS